VIYSRDASGKFQPYQQIEFAFDDFTCIQFYFNKENTDELLFFTATEIIKFNYMKGD